LSLHLLGAPRDLHSFPTRRSSDLRAVVADLSRAHPDLPDLVERVDIYKWGHAMVRPTPGFIWGEERTRAQAGPARVHFAHSDLRSEEHTSELQSRENLVCRLLLEK